MLLTVITSLSLIVSVTLCYLLCLAFIGASKAFKEVVFPILLMGSIALISKAVFHFPGEIHSIITLTSCLLLVKLFNREIGWMLSALGTFLTLIILLFGGFLYPFLSFLAGVIPTKTEPYSSWEWVYMSLLEIILPLIVLVLLKVKKISLMKYLGK